MTAPRLTEHQLLAVLVVVVLLVGLGAVRWPDQVPVSALAIPVIYGGWRLSTRSLVILVAGAAGVLVVDLATSPLVFSVLEAGVVGVVSALAFRYAWLRQQWGLRPRAGMALLLTIRDRLRAQGEPPTLPGAWVMARALRSAGDEAFRGDFTLVHEDSGVVEVMLVDVSGHGLSVASRSSQLAGAFGGLVGVLPPDEAMRACNDYLVRQEWQHDYATAVHVAMNLTTGEGTIRSAGHPSAGVRRVDGRWRSVEASGPILGLARKAVFEPSVVRLDDGDLLVLVSDGSLAEDFDVAPHSWSRVIDAVEKWLADGAPSGTRELPLTPGQPMDDQTIVVLGRPHT
jgi:hypothetical protein